MTLCVMNVRKTSRFVGALDVIQAFCRYVNWQIDNQFIGAPEKTLGRTKGGKRRDVITHNVIWANQKTESFKNVLLLKYSRGKHLVLIKRSSVRFSGLKRWYWLVLVGYRFLVYEWSQKIIFSWVAQPRMEICFSMITSEILVWRVS